MEKSLSGSGTPSSSSPAMKSTPIPEDTTESASEKDQQKPEPLSTKSTRVTAEPLEVERSPLNIATSTITEWFGKVNISVVCEYRQL